MQRIRIRVLQVRMLLLNLITEGEIVIDYSFVHLFISPHQPLHTPVRPPLHTPVRPPLLCHHLRNNFIITVENDELIDYKYEYIFISTILTLVIIQVREMHDRFQWYRWLEGVESSDRGKERWNCLHGCDCL